MGSPSYAIVVKTAPFWATMRAEPDDKDFVIYYDCCVPASQFKRGLVPAIRFAEHLFCRDIFPEVIQQDDKKLFDAVVDHWLTHYPSRPCLFLTIDSGFKEQVERHPAFNKGITFIYLDIPPSEEMNWLWAKKVARKLLEVYLEFLELKSRRMLPAALVLFKVGSLLRMQFGTA